MEVMKAERTMSLAGFSGTVKIESEKASTWSVGVVECGDTVYVSACPPDANGNIGSYCILKEGMAINEVATGTKCIYVYTPDSATINILCKG